MALGSSGLELRALPVVSGGMGRLWGLIGVPREVLRVRMSVFSGFRVSDLGLRVQV